VQFGYVRLEAEFGKQAGNVCSQSPTWSFLSSDGIAENVANLFLHAAAVAFGSTLQASLHRIFDVPDHELSHHQSPFFIMISCYHIWQQSAIQPGDPESIWSIEPVGPWVLEEQIGQVRKKSKTQPDAGLRALRHTFLTEAGEHTDPFTLQYVAGHDNIKTTMR
jgi:hypothetical protein